MKLLIFDTETTGLPKKRQPAEKGPNNWPHLVSISWIVLESDTNEILSKKNYIIFPQRWEIPEESYNIHGITEAVAMDKGWDLYAIIQEFLNVQCDAWVSHNLEFDMGVIVNAVLWDLGLQFPGTPQKKFCTMLLSKPICKLPGAFKNTYKVPKLKELYHHAFGKYPSELLLHSSMYDTEILTELVKNYSPLRKAMGLITRNAVQSDVGTLRICLKHADGDVDMGE